MKDNQDKQIMKPVFLKKGPLRNSQGTFVIFLGSLHRNIIMDVLFKIS